MNQEKIGRFIASCRKECGYTQASLGEKLGITDRAVSKCLRNLKYDTQNCYDERKDRRAGF